MHLMFSTAFKVPSPILMHFLQVNFYKQNGLMCCVDWADRIARMWITCCMLHGHHTRGWKPTSEPHRQQVPPITPQNGTQANKWATSPKVPPNYITEWNTSQQVSHTAKSTPNYVTELNTSQQVSHTAKSTPNYITEWNASQQVSHTAIRTPNYVTEWNTSHQLSHTAIRTANYITEWNTSQQVTHTAKSTPKLQNGIQANKWPTPTKAPQITSQNGIQTNKWVTPPKVHHRIEYKPTVVVDSVTRRCVSSKESCYTGYYRRYQKFSDIIGQISTGKPSKSRQLSSAWTSPTWRSTADVSETNGFDDREATDIVTFQMT